MRPSRLGPIAKEWKLHFRLQEMAEISGLFLEAKAAIRRKGVKISEREIIRAAQSLARGGFTNMATKIITKEAMLAAMRQSE